MEVGCSHGSINSTELHVLSNSILHAESRDDPKRKLTIGSPSISRVYQRAQSDPHGEWTMENVAEAQTEGAREKKGLKARAFGELEKYVVITAYLWLLFALFSLHKQLVQGHGVSTWQQGFAILNALIFAKVILIGQALEVGKRLERRALVWVVLGKSLIFAILLLAFHIAEEAIRAWFESKPLSQAFADLGGTLPGLLSYAAIFF